MMDLGVSIRCVLMWAAWIAGGAVGAVAVVVDNDHVGRLGLALLGVACMLTVLNDNARTRSTARRLQREAWEHETGRRITSVP